MRTDRFDHEFVGLFIGEGCVDIARQGRAAHHLRPRVRIGMGSKDRTLLEAVQARYGGSLTVRPSDGSVTWQVSGAKGLTRIYEVLSGSVLPSAKRSEVALLKEAISLRAQPERMAEIKHELTHLKRRR